MSKTKKKVVLSTCIVLVVCIASCCIFVGCSSKESSNASLENDFSTEMINSENVSLSAGVAFAAADNGVSKQLTATIYPSNATNKLVDWSIAWAGTGNGAIGSYLTLTPSSDGSTTATVTCHKAFTGEAVVTVTTRESGFTASCVIKYVGIPTQLDVSTSVSNSGGYYVVRASGDHVFTCTPNNSFGKVGDTYKKVECTLTGVGNINVCKASQRQGGSLMYDESNLHAVPLDSIKNQFITINNANGTVTVKSLKAIQAYYKSRAAGQMYGVYVYEDMYKSGAESCYFNLNVKIPGTSVSKDIKIKIDPNSVAGVSLAPYDITF